MFGTTRKQAEIFDKLLLIAGGDLDLVQEAIWSVSEQGKPADLKEVIEYIRSRRDARFQPDSRSSERKYAAA